MEVESNILASNRLRENSDHQIYDRKGNKEVIPTSSTSQSIDSKNGEMAKLVKILTSKLNKLELEKNSNKPAQEGKETPINLGASLHLYLFLEREETMIFRGREEKMKIKEFPLHSRIMQLMTLRKVRFLSMKIQIKI